MFRAQPSIRSVYELNREGDWGWGWELPGKAVVLGLSWPRNADVFLHMPQSGYGDVGYM